MYECFFFTFLLYLVKCSRTVMTGTETKYTVKLWDNLNKYVNNTVEILKLSAPLLNEVSGAEVYRAVLTSNFRYIGVLAAENRKILNEYLFPILESSAELNEATIRVLMNFANALIDPYTLSTLDIPIMVRVADRIFQNAVEKKDDREIIKALDIQLLSNYTMMNLCDRQSASYSVANYFRQKGFEAGRKINQYLDYDRFQSLKDENARATVLVDARYRCVMYDDLIGDDTMNKKNMDDLQRAYELNVDPFYHEQVPDYDWKYHIYRTLDYFSIATEVNNERGFSQEQIEMIRDRMMKLNEIYHANENESKQLTSPTTMNLYLLRNNYLADRSSPDAYRDELLALYGERDTLDYSLDGVFCNVLIPLEYIASLDQNNIRDDQYSVVDMLYNNILRYCFSIPKLGCMSYMLKYVSKIIARFIETPNGFGFQEYVLYAMVALHPPTYIHTLGVSKIAECLCENVIEHQPEKLIGFLGCASVEDVIAKKAEIMDFTVNSALCHDFGKLPMIDTIFNYGRNLNDLEFELIKAHPLAGKNLLEQHKSTEAYKNIALCHHIWFDGSKGYPAEVDTSVMPEKPIIDIIAMADCMDAATDTVGRSYAKGKTFDEFVTEVKEQRGTRYDSYLVDLLDKEDVREELQRILTDEREKNYYSAYDLLSNM